MKLLSYDRSKRNGSSKLLPHQHQIGTPECTNRPTPATTAMNLDRAGIESPEQENQGGQNSIQITHNQHCRPCCGFLRKHQIAYMPIPTKRFHTIHITPTTIPNKLRNYKHHIKSHLDKKTTDLKLLNTPNELTQHVEHHTRQTFS